ncbi:glycosyltransferase family 2 protein [Patescibacteria group bacterium]|nr:glycosyltransferase family 2 protein [Patescibacteria group bacterium]
MKKEPKISIIIPVKNSSLYLENCLKSIYSQSYKNVEVIIVDSHSKDKTKDIAKKYKCMIFDFEVNLKKGKFDAPYKRNFGVTKAKGEIVYYLDADMELPKGLLAEIAQLIGKNGYDALVIPEDSFGIGIWAKAKQLERRCYWGDDTVEAARVFKKSVWDELGGLDTSLGGGGDDWDLHHRLIEGKYKYQRTELIIGHNEGKLSIINLIKKRFMYGRDSVKYLVKKPKQGLASYFPIRMAYIRNWRRFLANPLLTLAFIVMRFFEYAAGFAGIVYSQVKK